MLSCILSVSSHRPFRDGFVDFSCPIQGFLAMAFAVRAKTGTGLMDKGGCRSSVADAGARPIKLVDDAFALLGLRFGQEPPSLRV